MRYEFINIGCPKRGEGCDGCHHEVDIPISNAPSIGALRKCHIRGCKRKLVRIFSNVLGHIKGSAHDWKPGETMHMKLPNGQQGSFSFVDHPHTDPAYQRNLAQIAGRAGLGGNAHGLSNARYDEKSGRMVVDVASTIKDPLGAMEKAKKDGRYSTQTKHVNTPVKIRGKKK